uniref:Cyclin-dependent kinase inhibitor domain-containing protein n=1 Tax=Glossina brevipalpis TaxID=37001 RepID=A0A1A9X4C2_9MUSC
MSTARVLNPVFNEIYKIRSSPTVLQRNLPCSHQLNRIKKDLFGPINVNETNRMFKEELAKHHEEATQKWGFDFRAGSPLAATNPQFIWERITSQESIIIPEVYTLTRNAHVHPSPVQPTPFDLLMDDRAERENDTISGSATDTDSCDEFHVENSSALTLFKIPANPISRASTSEAAGPRKILLRKRQPKITEYLKERKRLAQTPKKVAPAKRMRTSLAGNIQSIPPLRHSVDAHQISSHFPLRSQHD